MYFSNSGQIVVALGLTILYDKTHNPYADLSNMLVRKNNQELRTKN